VITNAQAPDDLVYNVAKTIVDHNDELAAIHPAGQFLNLKYAKDGVAIPFHPGAEKFLKERGVLK